MKKLLLPIFMFSSILFGQAGSTAVPFLMISTSVEANGMGGIMTVANSSSPSSMMFNPAQLGVSSQTDFMSAEIYSRHTNWLPAFRLSDLWMNSYSFMCGMKLPNEDSLNVSVGFGYSRLYLNLGEFVVTTERDPTAVGRFRGYESSDNFSAGVGLDYGFTAAFGMTLKKITSSLGPIGTAEERGSGQANVWATDIGLLFKFPIADLLLKNEMGNVNNFSPFFDINAAYTLNNIGGSVVYIDVAQADPLPRTARLGWSSEAGIKMHTEKIDFSLINITIAREAENLLLERFSNGSWKYNGAPLGNINIYDHLIASEPTGYVSVRRGFSINFLETVTIRQGSYDGDGNLAYTTSGYTISSKGVLKYLNSISTMRTGSPIVLFLFSHLEFRLSHSEYEHHDIVGGTNFDNLVFSFHY